MNNVETCSKLLIVWMMNKDRKEVMFSPEYEKASFIAKVLRKKLEVFKINVKIPDPLIMLIEICTECSPGVSQLMLKEVLVNAKSRGKKFNPDEEYIITPEDFSFTYPESFPIMNEVPDDRDLAVPAFMRDILRQESVTSWEEYFHKAWDNQKIPETGANKCDTLDWWWEIYA